MDSAMPVARPKSSWIFSWLHRLHAGRFALAKIRLVPNNESAWNYLQGSVDGDRVLISMHISIIEADGGTYAAHDTVSTLCLELTAEPAPPRFALAALVAIYAEQAKVRSYACGRFRRRLMLWQVLGDGALDKAVFVRCVRADAAVDCLSCAPSPR